MQDSQIAGLVVSLVGGLILYISGYLLNKFPPKDINVLYGYRTKRSMKNNQLWEIANKYSGELIKKYALIFVIVGCLVSILFKGIGYFFAIVGLMIASIVLVIVKVEKRLKDIEKRFDS